MSITFETTHTIATGGMPNIAAESDSTIYMYYLDDTKVSDINCFAEMGVYDTITWSEPDRTFTTEECDRIGVKNFPNVGGIGFYRTVYSDECKLKVPIHAKTKSLKQPTLVSLTVSNNALEIVVEPPTDVTYDCYRVICRQGYFAFEYILYKTTASVVVPNVKGTYTCTCIGYKEFENTCSYESESIELVITEGNDNFVPTGSGGGGGGSSSDVQEQLDALDVRVTDTEDSIGTLESSLTALTGTVTALSTDVVVLDTNLTALEEEVSELEPGITTDMLPSRFCATLSSGTVNTDGSTTYTVVHNLNTFDLLIDVYEQGTNVIEVAAYITKVNANTLSVTLHPVIGATYKIFVVSIPEVTSNAATS